MSKSHVPRPRLRAQAEFEAGLASFRAIRGRQLRYVRYRFCGTRLRRKCVSA